MPLFAPLTGRSAGVLLHPSSLPGPHGTGTLGSWAYRWVELMASAGLRAWQMLPIGPVADDGSPYRSFSSCAGNPYLIDLPTLVEQGFLSWQDLEPLNHIGATKVDFAAQHALRLNVLRRAYQTYVEQPSLQPYGPVEAFSQAHRSWLRPYALFMALKELYAEAPWSSWSDDKHRTYAKARRLKLSGDLLQAVQRHEFWQYLFEGQWQRLRAFAAQRGVQLIGDVPFYVPEDSVDVWSDPGMFLLDDRGQPTHVGGCPPDYFDPQGQRWGNPIYRWQVHASSDYRWWIDRFRRTFQLFDVVRIDHFRAFYDYWEIPASSPGAQQGRWVLGPGLPFFQELQRQLPHARMIAEDMGGDLHPGVHQLLADTGLPGLSVLQFAFGGDATNPYLPHNARHNQIAYTGTHDNDTLVGWLSSAPDHQRGHAMAYLGCHHGVFVEAALRATLGTVCSLAVVPVQDLLALGAWARMNTPGTTVGNWQWRLSEEEFHRIDVRWLNDTLRLFGRA